MGLSALLLCFQPAHKRQCGRHVCEETHRCQCHCLHCYSLRLPRFFPNYRRWCRLCIIGAGSTAVINPVTQLLVWAHRSRHKTNRQTWCLCAVGSHGVTKATVLKLVVPLTWKQIYYRYYPDGRRPTSSLAVELPQRAPIDRLMRWYHKIATKHPYLNWHCCIGFTAGEAFNPFMLMAALPRSNGANKCQACYKHFQGSSGNRC